MEWMWHKKTKPKPFKLVILGTGMVNKLFYWNVYVWVDAKTGEKHFDRGWRWRSITDDEWGKIKEVINDNHAVK